MCFLEAYRGAGTWRAGWATAHPEKIRVGPAHAGNATVD